MLLRLLAWLIAITLAFAPAAEASQATLVTPSAPLPMTGLASFLNAAYLSVGSCNSGTSAPANGTGAAAFTYECWANSTSNPTLFQFYDSASWVKFGQLDTSGHVWTPFLGVNPVSGGIPYGASGGATGTFGWSAALTANGVLLGGGAGTAPTSTAAAGAADKVFGAWSGDPASFLSINNCTGSLTYSTSTHTFGCNTGAGTGTVTEQKNTFGFGLSSSGNCDNTSSNVASPCNSLVSLTTASNVLSGDVALNNTGNYFDGPSMAQGTTGTWFASGTVTLVDTGIAANFKCKLWDGTTVIASTEVTQPTAGAGWPEAAHLAGTLASPAANIRISCNDPTGTNGKILFNSSGNSKDSSIWGVRIQ